MSKEIYSGIVRKVVAGALALGVVATSVGCVPFYDPNGISWGSVHPDDPLNPNFYDLQNYSDSDSSSD